MKRRKTKNKKLKKKGKPSLSLPTSEPPQEIESVNKVFSIDLLLDEIVKHSVYNTGEQTIDKNVIASTRLVNRSWLQATSRTLKHLNHPAILIELGCENNCTKVNGKVFRKKGNILDEFVSVFSKSYLSTGSILPIRLFIDQLYFIKENKRNLSKFFAQCGHQICFLHVNFPPDGGTMTLKCNHFNFPMLHHIRFAFESWDKPPGYKSMASVFGNNKNGFTFLQDILQNSNNLRNLHLQYDEKDGDKISSISVPESLQKFVLNTSITTNELHLFTKNKLPNLRNLRLNIQTVSGEHLISNILDRLQNKLTNLHMDLVVDENEQTICIKFPLMENLTSLSLYGQGFEMSQEQGYHWSKCIPNLVSLELYQIPQTLFTDWFSRDTRFENVKELNVLMACSRRNLRTMSPTLSSVSTIRDSFPNVHKLTLYFKLEQTSGLKFLFRNFGHLKQLCLDVCTDNLAELVGYEMVSLFLGVSWKQATALVDKTQKNVNVRMDNPESIMNMKELNSLTVSVSEKVDPFILNIISKYGFKRMPKLQEIKLGNQLLPK